MPRQVPSVEYQFFMKQDVSRYAGQWIAIKGRKIVASSEDVLRAAKELRRKGIENAVYAKIPSKSEILLY